MTGGSWAMIFLLSKILGYLGLSQLERNARILRHVAEVSEPLGKV